MGLASLRKIFRSEKSEPNLHPNLTIKKSLYSMHQNESHAKFVNAEHSALRHLSSPTFYDCTHRPRCLLAGGRSLPYARKWRGGLAKRSWVHAETSDHGLGPETLGYRFELSLACTYQAKPQEIFSASHFIQLSSASLGQPPSTAGLELDTLLCTRLDRLQRPLSAEPPFATQVDLCNLSVET